MTVTQYTVTVKEGSSSYEVPFAGHPSVLINLNGNYPQLLVSIENLPFVSLTWSGFETMVQSINDSPAADSSEVSPATDEPVKGKPASVGKPTVSFAVDELPTVIVSFESVIVRKTESDYFEAPFAGNPSILISLNDLPSLLVSIEDYPIAEVSWQGRNKRRKYLPPASTPWLTSRGLPFTTFAIDDLPLVIVSLEWVIVQAEGLDAYEAPLNGHFSIQINLNTLPLLLVNLENYPIIEVSWESHIKMRKSVESQSTASDSANDEQSITESGSTEVPEIPPLALSSLEAIPSVTFSADSLPSLIISWESITIYFKGLEPFNVQLDGYLSVQIFLRDFPPLQISLFDFPSVSVTWEGHETMKNTLEFGSKQRPPTRPASEILTLTLSLRGKPAVEFSSNDLPLVIVSIRIIIIYIRGFQPFTFSFGGQSFLRTTLFNFPSLLVSLENFPSIELTWEGHETLRATLDISATATDSPELSITENVTEALPAEEAASNIQAATGRQRLLEKHIFLVFHPSNVN